MTAYSAITAGQIDAESPVDVTLAVQWTNRVLAMFEGDASASGVRLQTSALEQTGGSEAVTQACMRASAIGQGELKTTTAENSQSGIGTSTVVLTGGQYAFLLESYVNNSGTNVTPYYDTGYNNTSYATYVSFNNDTGFAAYIRHRYIQASPPYDLGNGEIPLFIFAIIDNATGEIFEVTSAPEAPWHYNGPTNIKADYYKKDGKGYRLRRDMSAFGMTMAQAKAAGGVAVRDYMQAFQAADAIEQEITQAIKNTDMNLIPHPWHVGNNLVGKTVVMIDPVSSIVQELFENKMHDEFSVNELFHDGFITIDNQTLERGGPAGLKIVTADWKLTT